MPFSNAEQETLLNAHGVGPKVIERLEQIGIGSLDQLAECSADEICSQISALLMSSCWRNSPQARQSIQTAIDTARNFKQQRVAEV